MREWWPRAVVAVVADDVARQTSRLTDDDLARRERLICAAVRFDGGFMSTEFGEPVLAPEYVRYAIAKIVVSPATSATGRRSIRRSGLRS